jgi:hypothetical protein
VDIFNIVKAKYSSRTRNILIGCLFFFYLIICPFLFTYYPLDHFTNSIISIKVIKILIIFSLLYIIVNINSKIIGKIYVIGNLCFDEKELKISTVEIVKQIPYKDIRLIKYKIATGKVGVSRVTNYDTYILFIIYKSGEILKIHVTKDYFKDGKRQQKFIWNNNYDLFDYFQVNFIRYEYDKNLSELECITH